MPRFTPDPTKVASGFLTYPKGTYRVELGQAQSFISKNKAGVENHGVKFTGKIVSSIDNPAFVGKPHPITCYQHTEGSEAFSKAIQMAALGCKKDAEFDAKFGTEDWTYNTDDKSAGEGWHKMDGQVIDITYGETGINTETGDEQSGNAKYSPVF